jgi:hypothetical protein
VTGPELKQLRKDLGDAIGRSLSAADMAKLCGLAPGGADTIRRWEVSGPSGPAAELLRILAMASDRHPIIENFNIFDRFNIPEKERPARREEFRKKMRDEVRGRLERPSEGVPPSPAIHRPECSPRRPIAPASCAPSPVAEQSPGDRASAKVGP